jgi:hypothetical protein
VKSSLKAANISRHALDSLDRKLRAIPPLGIFVLTGLFTALYLWPPGSLLIDRWTLRADSGKMDPPMMRFGKSLLLGPMLLFTGCVHGPDRPVGEAPGPPITKVGGEGLELDAHTAADQAALLAKVDEHLAAHRHAWAEALVQRHLDVAIEALRRRSAKKTPSEAELVCARIVDERLGHPADDGWLARLHGQDRGGLQHAEETLVKAQDLTRQKQWQATRDLLSPQQPALAAFPYQAIHAGLMLAEAQRHLGELRLAGQTWQQAVVVASRRASRWLEPALWEELAARRPVPTPWPPEMAPALVPLLPESLRALPADPTFVPEALAWFAIGAAQLERAEPAAALTSFKRGDSHGMFPAWDEFLALHQSKALLALGQGRQDIQESEARTP